MNSSRQVSVRARRASEEVDGLAGQARRAREDGFKVGRADQHEDREDAERKAEIADALTTKALIAAAFANGFWYQNPISR